MKNRVGKMWRVSAVRESNRLDMALARCAFLLLILIGFATRPNHSKQIGTHLYSAYFIVSGMLLVFLAIRLASDVVGLRGSGWFELLQMTGIDRQQWIRLRYLQSCLAFLSVWLIRLPALFLIFTLGGVRFTHILCGEALLVFTFLVMLTVGLWSAQTAKTRGNMLSGTLGLFFFFEYVLFIPRQFANSLPYGFQLPLFIQDYFEALRIFSFGRLMVSFLSGSLTWDATLPSLVWYSGLAFLFLWRLHATLFVPPVDDPQELSSSEASSSATMQETTRQIQRRESRRCWDDVLAWQAFAQYGGGNWLNWSKSIIYPGLLLYYLYMQFWRSEEELHGIAIAINVLALLFSGFIPISNCMDQEIKNNTLMTLLLTPHDNIDFYRGWRRGIWKGMLPDVCAWLAILVIGLAVFPQSTPITLLLGLCAILSGPFMMLTAMIPLSLKALPAALFVVVSLILIIIFLSVTGVLLQSAWAALVVGVPLWWGFNQCIFYWMLPHWIDHRMYNSLNAES